MHLSDIQNLFGPSSSIHVVWDGECSPSFTLMKVRPSEVGTLSREATKEMCRLLESDKIRSKFRRWPQHGYAAIEKSGKHFTLKLFGFVTVVVPQPLVDQVFSTGNQGFFEDRGYRFRTYREQNRHGVKWVKTEVCECAPGLDPKNAVRYKAQLVGQGETLSEAFRSVISSTTREIELQGNAWYS